MRKNKISNVNMNRYAEIGSPWQAPLSKLKYCVVVPSLVKHETSSFNKISIYVIKLLQNPDVLKTKQRKPSSRDSKVFQYP